MNGKISTVGYMFLGMIGSIIFATSDYLTSYGDPTPLSNKVMFYTVGVSQIPGWRNNLAMITSILSVIPFGIGLFYLENFITSERNKKIYHYTLSFSFTGWLFLHYFFTTLFYTLHYLMTKGYKDIAIPISEALYSHFFWVLPTCLVIISIPHAYYFWLMIKGDTIFSRYMAFLHHSILSYVLYGIDVFFPEGAFKAGFFFASGNQSSVLFFAILIIYFSFFSKDHNKKQN